MIRKPSLPARILYYIILIVGVIIAFYTLWFVILA